jgi:hypothetical protein
MRKYPSYRPDTSALQQVSARLAMAGGVESHEFFPYGATVVLADLLGEKVIDFPGDHIGYRDHPGEFACQLRGLLAPQRSR